MKLRFVLVFSLVFCLGANVASAKERKPLITEKEKISYGIGLSLGKDFQAKSIDIDPEALVQGIDDVLRGTKPALSGEEYQETMALLQKRIAERRAEQNLQQGKLFLEANRKKKGVVETASGLQYEVIREGSGPSPKASDRVVTNYRGTLINGREFDSSFSRGKPAQFAVNEVFKGWTEALLLMKTGAKWRLFIPSRLAYGKKSAKPSIEPNSTLILEVELLKIIPQQ